MAISLFVAWGLFLVWFSIDSWYFRQVDRSRQEFHHLDGKTIPGETPKLLVGNLMQVYPLLSPNLDSPQKDKHYAIALILGWISTFIAATAYVLFTRKYETGNYKIPDLLVFSFSNGILEQFMFIFWLLLGCYIGKLSAPNSPKLIFTFGYISYAIFSGLIHAFFWVTVLPHHEPFSMPVALAVMSLLWMWLFWRYQALLPIIAMHVVIDLFTIGHLNFTWFESLQSSIQSWLTL